MCTCWVSKRMGEYYARKRLSVCVAGFVSAQMCVGFAEVGFLYVGFAYEESAYVGFAYVGSAYVGSSQGGFGVVVLRAQATRHAPGALWGRDWRPPKAARVRYG